MSKLSGISQEQLFDYLKDSANCPYSVLEVAVEIGKRTAKQLPKMSMPVDIVNELVFLQNKKQEHFVILTLNGAHQVIKRHIITVGLLNRTIVHPREVFRPAILDNSAAIVICHNHPSGNTEPSMEDIGITEKLKNAGEILGIAVLDHVIISNTGYYSFAQNCRM